INQAKKEASDVIYTAKQNAVEQVTAIKSSNAEKIRTLQQDLAATKGEMEAKIQAERERAMAAQQERKAAEKQLNDLKAEIKAAEERLKTLKAAGEN
ncbi:MAG: hypothetical protein HRU12_11400, partial [Phaeodactylibacter sp.]|nr:hypothetical protein [Phaeodactylibacter sp.]